MPRLNDTIRPQAEIDQAVKRFLNREASAVSLAKQYKISKAGFYLWVKKYKQGLLEASKRSGMTPASVEKSDKQTLIAEVQQLKLENRKLRDKVLDYMIRVGE